MSKIASDYFDFLLIVGFMFLNIFVQLFRIFQLYIKIDFFKQKETPVRAKNGTYVSLFDSWKPISIYYFC